MIVRKILKIFVILIGTVLALLLTTIIGVRIYLETDMARRLIQNQINAAIPGHIRWERQELSVFKGQLAFENVRIRGIENDTIINAHRLAVDIRLIDLLNKELIIASAILDRLEVFLETDADGRLNLMRAFVSADPPSPTEPDAKTASEGLPFTIRINALLLKQGVFSFAMPAEATLSENTALPAGQALSHTQKLRLEDINIALQDADLNQRSGRVKITIGAGNVDMAGIHTPIHGFQFATALADGRLAPVNLELNTPGSHLVLSGAMKTVFDEPQADLKLTLDSELSEIRRIFGSDADLSGPVRLALTAAGPFKNPDVTLSLDYSDGRLMGMAIDAISLESRMQDRQITIDRLDAASPAGEIHATGFADLRTAFAAGFLSPPTDLSALSYHLDLGGAAIKLSACPGTDLASGQLFGELAPRLFIEGRGISPETLTAKADVSVQAKNLSVENTIEPLDLNITARAGMSGGNLTIDPLTIEIQDSQDNEAAQKARIHLSGAYHLFQKTIDLSADADIANLESLLVPLGISDVSGNAIVLQTRISGSAAQPAVDARLQGRNFGYRNFTAGDLQADVGFEGGLLNVRSLDVANGDSKIAINGSIQVADIQNRQLMADPELNLALTADPLFLQDFVSGMSGQLTISGDISGSPDRLKGTITADGSNLDLGVQTISAVSLAARLDGRKVFIEPLEISLAPNHAIRAAGWVSLDQAYALTLTSDAIDLTTVNQLADTDLGGRIELSATGSGTFSVPQLDGQANFTKLTVRDKTLPDTKIHAALTDQTIHIDARKPLAVNIRYNLTNRDILATADLSDTELSPFFQLAGQTDLSGQMTATLTAEGNTEKIEQMRANLNISDLNIFHKATELIRTTDFAADFSDGAVTIPGSRFSLLTDGYFTLKGAGALAGKLDFTVDGRIPAALADGIVPGIGQPEGQLNLNVRITGASDQPDISGTIALDALGFIVADTLQKFHDITGSIRITDEAVTVSGLTGRLDDGEFDLETTIDIEKFQPTHADVTLSARALPITLPDMLELQINTDLKLTGTPDRSSLKGTLTLLEGNYFKDVNLSLIDTAGEMGKRKRQTAPRTETSGMDLPFLKNLSIDVTVDSRNPMMVDNNLALLSIRPQLRIHGTARAPLVTGRAEVTQGTVTYRDTEFEVQKGVVDFVNPYRIEPTVDIRAQARVREWTITLTVSGPPDNLDFRLSSTPPEEDADILSLLVLGKTTRELASGSDQKAASPEEMLANLMAAKLADEVREGTGLDIVEVEYRKNGTEAQSADEVRVTVGKQLSRRVTVKYGVESKGGVIIQQSTAIYKLLENLSLNAFQNTEGDFGGEMRYRLEFQ